MSIMASIYVSRFCSARTGFCFSFVKMLPTLSSPLLSFSFYFYTIYYFYTIFYFPRYYKTCVLLSFRKKYIKSILKNFKSM